jgi:hypothetical protein
MSDEDRAGLLPRWEEWKVGKYHVLRRDVPDVPWRIDKVIERQGDDLLAAAWNLARARPSLDVAVALPRTDGTVLIWPAQDQCARHLTMTGAPVPEVSPAPVPRVREDVLVSKDERIDELERERNLLQAALARKHTDLESQIRSAQESRDENGRVIIELRDKVFALEAALEDARKVAELGVGATKTAERYAAEARELEAALRDVNTIASKCESGDHVKAIGCLNSIRDLLKNLERKTHGQT